MKRVNGVLAAGDVVGVLDEKRCGAEGLMRGELGTRRD